MKSIITFLLILLISIMQLVAQTTKNTSVVTSIDSYTTFQGYDETIPHLGQGEYQIFYDNIDGVLDRPFIIVDGFDPEDFSGISSMYNYLDHGSPSTNYLDELRDQGVDVIILNFPTYTRPDDGEIINGGGDYIERNGLILVNLIETINAEKVGEEKAVVVGPSMGGLVTRYALTYMEQNALNHESGLWVSFDSPHLGANIPISFQYAINYLAELPSAPEDVINLRDIRLNSPAAKQMLLDHYIAHLQSGSDVLQDVSIQLPTPNPYRTTFMTTMNSLGFPSETRNIAIINGSLNSTMVETPGATIFDFRLDLGSNLGMDWVLHYTPDANINNFQIDFIQPVIYSTGTPITDPFITVAESPASSAGIDSCPGGTVLFETFFGSSPTETEQQIIDELQVEAFSFIPTLSSMAIDEDNWYNSIDGSETIPFDDYIGGNINEEHMTFNEDTVDFLNDEIRSFFHLAIEESDLSMSFKMLGNPVQDTIEFLVDSKYKTLEIKILNNLGQVVSKHTLLNEASSISIPSPSLNGLYFLSISSENTQIVKKFIVKR